MRNRRTLSVVLLGIVLAISLWLPGALGQGFAAAGPLRIGIFTDLHAKVMTDYAARLSACVAAMTAWPADLVIELGDLVDGMEEDKVDTLNVLADAESIFARFLGPRYYVLGNHDVHNLSDGAWRAATGAPSSYWSFDAGSYHIAILDAEYSEHDEAVSATWEGERRRISPVELDWLRADLAATEKPTIVCVHQRVDGALVDSTKQPQVLNADDLRRILEFSGVVIAVFQGHDHTSACKSVNGIHYITFAALGNEGTPPSWAQVTLGPAGRTIDIVGTGSELNRPLTY